MCTKAGYAAGVTLAVLVSGGCGGNYGVGGSLGGAWVKPTGPEGRSGSGVSATLFSVGAKPVFLRTWRVDYRSLYFEGGKASSLTTGFSGRIQPGEMVPLFLEFQLGVGAHWAGGMCTGGPVAGAGIHLGLLPLGGCSGLVLFAEYVAAPVLNESGFPHRNLDGFSVGLSVVWLIGE